MNECADFSVCDLALEAGRRAAESEFRAQAVSYLPDRDAIEVITMRNGGFVIPRHMIRVLQNVNPDDLGKMELWPDGSLIEIKDLLGVRTPSAAERETATFSTAAHQ